MVLLLRLAVLLSAAPACWPGEQARTVDTAKRVGARGDSAHSADSAYHADSLATIVDTGAKLSAARAPRTTGPAATDRTPRSRVDSAVRLALATRLPGRSFNDSISFVTAIRAGLRDPRWPVRAPAPLPGALLPGRRIVAFYGNPLSKRMGILGERPPEWMLAKLDTIAAAWREADPSTPVQAALHLIVSVAQGQPGKDSMYRQRSDTGLIEKVYGWARQKHAIMFLDIQGGRSTIQAELPRLVPFLARPDVHLAVDPEFYMHHNREGRIPGQKIGAMDAADVNYAIEQLAQLVSRYHLPPKILVVHRFTTNMLQHPDRIHLDPRVQVVINMDGWGQPWLKFDTYRTCELAQPVQFTGFKLFFHNDTRKGDELLTPREVLALRPRPVYIQYQ